MKKLSDELLDELTYKEILVRKIGFYEYSFEYKGIIFGFFRNGEIFFLRNFSEVSTHFEILYSEQETSCSDYYELKKAYSGFLEVIKCYKEK